jgi:predicted MFS family arabinose efflux permease
VARALFLLFLFTTTHWTFVPLVVIINIVATFSGPAYSSLMKEIYPDGDRARIMGYTRVCMWSVSIIVTALGAWLLAVFGYRYVFPVAGIFGVASILVFGRISAHEASGDPSVGHIKFFTDSFKILHEDRGYAWFCAGIFFLGFADLMSAPVYAIFQVDELGVKTTWAGIYSIVCQIGTMIAFMYWGGYIDRIKPERVAAMQALAYSIVPLIYVFAFNNS